MKRTIKDLRELCKENGINSFQKGADWMEAQLVAAGVLESVTKTGKRSWRPGNRLDLINKQPGFRYRMVLNDPANIQKKKAEGWEMVTGTTDPSVKHLKPGEIQDGAEIDTTVSYREHVAMRLPEEIGKARDEYYKDVVERRRSGIKRAVQKQMAKGAEADGAPVAEIHGDVEFGKTIID